MSHLNGGGQQQGVAPIKPILNQSDRGTCPVNTFQNPGCQSTCHSDTECSEFQKCCEFGCGRRCLYPDPTTPCIHRLAVLDEEREKLARSVGKNATLNTQCASSGQFRRVQCQRETGQCWCVRAEDGKEVVGTRASLSTRNDPNCLGGFF